MVGAGEIPAEAMAQPGFTPGTGEYRWPRVYLAVGCYKKPSRSRLCIFSSLHSNKKRKYKKKRKEKNKTNSLSLFSFALW